MPTQPGMHQCLKVPELFSAICHFSSHRDPYNLARTCREFTSSALDDLWFELDEGIVPLLYCFPDGVIGRRIRGSGYWNWNYGYSEGSECRDTGFYIQRRPLAHEWNRVMFHASRVRSLRMCDDDMSDKRGERCYRLFLEYWPHGSRPLFPNLRSVLFEAQCEPISEFAVFATTSRPLRNISCAAFTSHLPDGFEDFDMHALATCIQISRDSIKSLSIDCGDCLMGPYAMDRSRRSFNGIFDDICEAFLRLKNLRSALLCNPLSSAVIAHFAHLPDLHTLTFAFVGIYHDPQLLAPHPDNFRSLRQVHIEIMTFPLRAVRAFFDNISGFLLEEAMIEFIDIGGGPLAGELTTLIHSISRHRSLHKIEIHRADGDVKFRPRDPANWPLQCSAVVRSFSRIPGLCVLSIASLPLHTSADDIHFIASTWPGMQILLLGGGTDTLATTSVHVTDLQPLVTKCPLLTTLSVTLLRRSPDAEDVLPVGVHEGVQCVSVVLRDPAVGPGHYHYPEKDCEALGLMFPKSRNTHFEVEFINKSCAPHFVDSDPDEYEYEEEEDSDE